MITIIIVMVFLLLGILINMYYINNTKKELQVLRNSMLEIGRMTVDKMFVIVDNLPEETKEKIYNELRKLSIKELREMGDEEDDDSFRNLADLLENSLES